MNLLSLGAEEQYTSAQLEAITELGGAFEGHGNTGRNYVSLKILSFHLPWRFGYSHLVSLDTQDTAVKVCARCSHHVLGVVLQHELFSRYSTISVKP
jgi:hypothetical protein